MQDDKSIDEQMFEDSIKLVNKTSGIYSQLADFNNVAFLANTENVDFANSYQISNAGKKVYGVFWQCEFTKNSFQLVFRAQRYTFC